MTQTPPYRQRSLFGDSDGRWHPDVVLMLRTTSQEDDRGSIITYGHAQTRFGLLTLATLEGSILHAHLGDTEAEGMASLQIMFPGVAIARSDTPPLSDFVRYLDDPGGSVPSFRITVSGTTFQVEVWRALLTIPFGERVSYGQLAAMVGRPDAVRAVGTAVGRNPVAFLIPCHRVVHANGRIGQFMWGSERKRAMLDWEAPFTSSGL